MTLSIPGIRRDVPLAPYTTYKIGGSADYFVEPRSAGELAAAVRAARDEGVPYFLLGLGANILVGDRGFRGLVIRNAALAHRFEGGLLVAESGAVVEELIESSLGRSLSGLEHFAGIPSTVGGALWQNLHFLSPDRSRTVYIEEVLESADILDAANVRRTVGKEFFGFSYDYSVLHDEDIVVLSASFRLGKDDPARIRRTFEENLAWRRERHPALDRYPSCGSVFKKAGNVGAGRLIEDAGLKGLCVGGARVSERHANFLVNERGATAADVRALIERVQAAVREKSGHLLEPEIRFVGEF